LYPVLVHRLARLLYASFRPRLAATALALSLTLQRITMVKGQVRSNRETKKPKKEKPKIAASAPSLTKIATPPKKK
jgi:hypothetical protein